MDLPETVEIGPRDAVDGSVIWLHGLGADGHDFEPIVGELSAARQHAIRFVFPHAPVRPVTLNGGLAMRAWYDIYSLERDGPVDEAGIRGSVAMLDGLIEREKERGVAAKNIILAGFSQGGVIAVFAALSRGESLGGLLALSTYAPLRSALENEHRQPTSLPVFMAHGTFDPVLPFEAGSIARTAIEDLGYVVDWHEYPMPHAVCPQEVTAIDDWLNARFQTGAEDQATANE